MKPSLFRSLLDAPDAPLLWDGAIHPLAWWREMAACPQDAIHHAEGDVATHTRMVVDALRADADWQALPEAERGTLLLAALLHDIAKPETTSEEDGRITARGHAGRGEVVVRRLLWEAGDVPFATREAVCALIRFHQHPFWLIERDDARYQALRIAQSARADHLALLAMADGRGRVCADRDDLLVRVACFREFCAEHGCLSAPYAFPNDHGRFLYFRSGGERDPDYCPYEEPGRPELILLSGLPGVGKDTWLRANLPDGSVVSLDAIRAELGIAPTDPQERVVQTARDRARAVLRRGESLVWNATSLSRELRGRRTSLCDDYGARMRIVYIEASAARQRRQNAGRDAAVPAAAMERIFRQWQLPDLTEAHIIEWQVTES